MTPITRQDILAHQAVVPWPAQYQVEQDLLLCQAMVALFEDAFLSSQVAMRGGTLLHKVHLAPPARYSEDIDLVVVGTRPAEHIPYHEVQIQLRFTSGCSQPRNMCKSVWEGQSRQKQA